MNIQNPGVRPTNNRVSGFTLVELMVAVAIISVVIALALPSYAEMTTKRKIASSAEQLSAFINQGHSEAVRLNQVVTVSYNRVDYDDWCVGFTLGEDGCDCHETNDEDSDYCAVDGIQRVMNNEDLGNTELVHRMSGGGSFSFEPVRGILLDPYDAMVIELHSDSRDYKVNVVVNESGNVKLCSTDDSHTLSGYKVC